MNRDDVVTLIISTVKELQDGQEGETHLTVDKSTVLFGRDGIFDSLKLVSLIVDLEQRIEDNGITVILNDERAVSQKHSPFRTIQSLANYTQQLIEEQQHVRA